MKKTFSSLAGWGDRLHWLWIMAAAPFLLFPTPRRSLAMLIIPGTWGLHWIVKRHPSINRDGGQPAEDRVTPIPITPLNFPILLLAFMVLVSIWATYDISLSLPKISGLVLGLGVYFALVREGRFSSGWMLGLLLFLSVGLGVGAISLIGTQWPSKIGILDSILTHLPNFISNFYGIEAGFSPNEVAGALTWVLPGFLSLSIFLLLPGYAQESLTGKLKLFDGKQKGWLLWLIRIGLWLSTVFVGVVFLLTQSRSGYIGLFISCLVLFWIALSSRGRWVAFAVILIAGLVLGLGRSEDRVLQVRDWMVGSGITTSGVLSVNSLEGRLEVWSRAIYGLQDFPFTGMGMNTFREVIHVLYPLFLTAPDQDLGHAHNEFLQAGLDLGIPGLVAFTALYIVAFWMLYRTWKNLPDAGFRVYSMERFVVLGLGGGLLAHLIFGLTDAIALGAKPGLLFWMLLALIAGLHAFTGTAPLDEIHQVSGKL